MLTPVVMHDNQFNRTTHPRLGDVVTWELWWGATYPGTYSQLELDWSLTARVRPTDAPTTTRLGGTEADTVEQPCIGSHGAVQFHVSLPLPVPETVTVTGALSVRVGTPLPGQQVRGPWHEVDPDTLTTGTVRWLRVVSMAWALRPTRHPGWHSNGPVPGTEWVYDLAEPPEQLLARARRQRLRLRPSQRDPCRGPRDMNEATTGSITVLVNGAAVGDGQALPPVVGERRTYHLVFHEVRTVFIDSGLYGEARWADTFAAEGRQVGPGAATWRIPLSGPGWTAIWSANRSQHGPARLYGYFQAEMSFFAPEPVSGTVTAVRGNWADLTLDITG